MSPRSEAAGPLRLDAPRCRVCGGVRPEDELDEYGWCPDCQERLERKVRIGKHLVALLVVVPFALWIATLDRGEFLPRWAWLLPLAAAYYLGLRIGREGLKGYVRWRRSRGAPK